MDRAHSHLPTPTGGIAPASGRAAGALLIVLALVAGIITFGPERVARAGGLPPGGTFIDDNGNTHEGFIEAIAAEGITQGCDLSGVLYCPDEPVTRGQMATFIARALELPAPTSDHFADDDGNTHEDNINRIFEAGVTTGFSDGTYQPDGLVRRDQMASFLARGIDLDAATDDYFGDDEGNTHEDNINAMAENGITLGCDASGNYCPTDNVRRDQMASFLGRALGLTEIIPPPAPSTSTTMVDNTIEVFDFGFDPNPFVIASTSGVVVFQVTEGTHRMVGGTPTAADPALFDTGVLTEGENSGFLLVSGTVGATINFHCSIHPDTMQGRIQFGTS